MLTLEQARNLKPGDILTIDRPGNRNGPERWRVNGKVKTWKRDASAISVPIKHGLYEYGYVTASNLHLFNLER